MPIAITVPRLGWSMEEGTFAGWLLPHGSTVTVGQPIYSLESDKVTMDVESLDAGTLHIPADAPAAGATVTVGQLLGHLLQADEASPSPTLPASPRARAAAKALGVDLATVTAREGAPRIIEADVLKLEKPAAPVRATVATRMEEAFRAPHFYLHADADATALFSLRNELLPLLPTRVSYNDILIKAVALALKQHPRLNAHWVNNSISPRTQIHIGLAVDAGDRLLVPVIRDADQKSLAAIAADRAALVERCRQNKAKREDLEDGSVTLSNLGTFGVDRFQAILNPPQSAILAIGRIAQRPVVVDGEVVARLTVPLSLSVDHRVADGLAAAKFLQTIVQLVEAPLRLALIQ